MEAIALLDFGRPDRNIRNVSASQEKHQYHNGVSLCNIFVLLHDFSILQRIVVVDQWDVVLHQSAVVVGQYTDVVQ